MQFAHEDTPTVSQYDVEIFKRHSKIVENAYIADEAERSFYGAYDAFVKLEFQ